MELEKLASIGTQLGLSGAELRKWIEEEQARQREERVLAREAAEREREAALKASECEVEALRLKLELKKLSRENDVNDVSSTQERDADIGLRFNASKLLIAFDEKKDDLDAYIRRFEVAGGRLMKQQPTEERATAAAVTRAQTKRAAKKFGRLKTPGAGDDTEATMPAMASVDVVFEDIVHPWYKLGASCVRLATAHIEGSKVATSHWRVALVIPGVNSVAILEEVQSSDGRQVCTYTPMSRALYYQRPILRTVMDLLQDPTIVDLGFYSATHNSCQHVVLKILGLLGIQVPTSLVTLQGLLHAATTEASVAAAFLTGAVGVAAGGSVAGS
ncbi:hypothetical protein HPB52_001133 [Rhipicephalus sanguineus]|uniref:Uncharacterized protein n=1 Tax=Rhipicephalus sanguineus TaxID=34632 RepID=A0A9D4P9U1_RHISA|nr:hypothetical protein HPB52_001133 [Rhipicephalus sanguineus]